jgi:hypothetical protein
MKDLLVLVPDKNTEAALNGLFSRPQAMGLRSISTDIFRHPQKDPGCHFNGIGFISTFINDYRYGLLVFDFEGSGAENQDADEVEGTLEKKLYDCGWADRAAVIIIRPELESWVWSNSPHVVDELGWTGRKPSLQNWLKEKNFLEENNIKPKRPKEAMEAALREARKARSSSIYRELATKVSFNRCTDVSFVKLKNTLKKWFSNETSV